MCVRVALLSSEHAHTHTHTHTHTDTHTRTHTHAHTHTHTHTCAHKYKRTSITPRRGEPPVLNASPQLLLSRTQAFLSACAGPPQSVAPLMPLMMTSDLTMSLVPFPPACKPRQRTRPPSSYLPCPPLPLLPPLLLLLLLLVGMQTPPLLLPLPPPP